MKLKKIIFLTTMHPSGIRARSSVSRVPRLMIARVAARRKHSARGIRAVYRSGAIDLSFRSGGLILSENLPDGRAI